MLNFLGVTDMTDESIRYVILPMSSREEFLNLQEVSKFQNTYLILVLYFLFFFAPLLAGDEGSRNS